MSYKISKAEKGNAKRVVQVRTTTSPQDTKQALKWWKAGTKEERGAQALATAAYIKDSQSSKNRQAALYARMYSNAPLMGAYGSQMKRPLNGNNATTTDRPTFNVVQACVDTLVSRISQARPRPVFLTDGADYKQRNLAKQLNQFANGELYQTNAHELGRLVLRDAEVTGTGCLKILEENGRVALQRTLLTELLVDNNDGLYATPRQLYQVALIDRDVLAENFPDAKTKVATAEEASVDDGAASDNNSSADQVLVVEAWHLPSGPDAGDGRHVITCSSGTLLDEKWDKKDFPFVFLRYSPRFTGFWGQGLAEQLFGTQVEINKLLITISRAINLVGVPRVLVENSSKIVKAHVNDQIGAILTYRGVKPEFINAMSNHPELYQQLQRLIDYAFQQSGVSSMAASSQKPAGLDSGKALREFDNIQTDRFATLSEDYDKFFIDLTYQIIDKARDIAERDGKYTTVYPNKDATREIDLPAADMLEDTFVIQCYSSSSLPRDPAGRFAAITEYVQAGFIDLKEGRRLLDFPDLLANEKLENASEEKIFKILDEIVDEGKYTPPDSFMDLGLCIKLSNQYYNLYTTAKLEPEREEMLRTFNTQALTLQQAAQSALMPVAPGGPLATAEPLPTSPLIPQGTAPQA